MTETPEPLAEVLLADGARLRLRPATDADIPAMLEVMHTAFGARPPRGAPPAALEETPATLAAALAEGAGYLAELDGTVVGVTLVSHDPDGTGVRLGRVSVAPDWQRIGIASMLVRTIGESYAVDGVTTVTVLARQEYDEIVTWWQRHGFQTAGTEGDCWVMTRALPVVIEVPDAESMQALGRRLAELLRPGDVIIATGDLGAGKTTLTQGIGAGLKVDGPVISPTFVLSRVHPPLSDGPGLVHVDAYRLDDSAELDDIDLDESVADSVTVIEWGAGLAEGMSDDRLEIDIRRGDDPDDDTRWVFLTPVGTRWSRAELAALDEWEG